MRFDVFPGAAAFVFEFFAAFFGDPESEEDSADGADCRGNDVVGNAVVVTSGKAEHEEIVAEWDEEEGGVEDADAEEAKGTGLVGEAEEVVEEVFQDLR